MSIQCLTPKSGQQAVSGQPAETLASPESSVQDLATRFLHPKDEPEAAFNKVFDECRGGHRFMSTPEILSVQKGKFGPLRQEHFARIVELVASKHGLGVATNYFPWLKIDDVQARFRIVRACIHEARPAQLKIIAPYIPKLKIPDEALRCELAMEFFKRTSFDWKQFQEIFQVTRPDLLIKMGRFLVNRHPASLAYSIKKFPLDLATRTELALKIAAAGCAEIIDCIGDFDIEDQAVLHEIGRLLIYESSLSPLTKLEKLTAMKNAGLLKPGLLDDGYPVALFMQICLKQELVVFKEEELANVVHHCWGYVQRGWWLLCDPAGKIDQAERVKGESFFELLERIEEMDDETDPYHEGTQKGMKKWLGYYDLQCHLLKIPEEPIRQKLLPFAKEIVKLRNPSMRYQLTNLLLKNHLLLAGEQTIFSPQADKMKKLFKNTHTLLFQILLAPLADELDPPTWKRIAEVLDAAVFKNNTARLSIFRGLISLLGANLSTAQKAQVLKVLFSPFERKQSPQEIIDFLLGRELHLKKKERAQVTDIFKTNLSSPIQDTEITSVMAGYLNKQFDFLDLILQMGEASRLKALEKIQELEPIFSAIVMSKLGDMPIPHFAFKLRQKCEEMRNPHALYMYVASLEDQNVIACLKETIVAVLTGQFQALRNTATEDSHLDVIYKTDPALKEKWTSAEKPLQIPGTHFSCKETEAFDDMINLGTEISSCQDVKGGTQNFCLMGYVCNGETRALVASDDANNGRIVERRILQILLDDVTEKPVLVLGRSYVRAGTPKAASDMLINLALKKAKEMNLPLVQDSFDFPDKAALTPYPNPIVSKKGRAPWVYADICNSGGGGAMPDGIYTIPLDHTAILWMP